MMINVTNFIADFKAKKIMNTQIAPTAVADYIKKTLEVKDYLPFAEKRELCERVLNACNTRDDSGLIKVDSVSRYIVFTILIISKYTNLEFSTGEDGVDSLDEYDMLCQADLLNPILDVIGAEYATCNNILNMMMADIVANNNAFESVLGNTLSKINNILDDLGDVLIEKVEAMELDLNQIDLNKYQGLIDLLPKK